jgi:hypothetical protein
MDGMLSSFWNVGGYFPPAGDGTSDDVLMLGHFCPEPLMTF